MSEEDNKLITITENKKSKLINLEKKEKTKEQLEEQDIYTYQSDFES